MTQVTYPFWIVLNENTGYTRRRHSTLDGAKRKAERLAGDNPGVKFFVLQVCGAAVAQRSVEWIEADEIPF